MRTLIFLLAMLAIIVGLGIATAPFLISTETFKHKVVQQINLITGYDISIGGKIKINAFPTLAVQLDDIIVRDMPDSAMLPVMRAKAITADIALMPLLRKEVIITNLALESPEITLQTSADSRINWKSSAVSPPESAGKKPAVASPPLRNLMFHDASIKNGMLIYSNEKTGERWSINAINLQAALTETSLLTFDGSIEWNAKPVRLNVAIDTLQQLLANQPVGIKGEIKNDLATVNGAGTWENAGYTGKLEAKLPSLRDFVLWLRPPEKPSAQLRPLAFSISTDAHCGKTYCNLTNSVLALDEMRAKGSIGAMWDSPAPQLTVDLATDELDLNFFLPAETLRLSGIAFFPAALAADKEMEWGNEPFNIGALQAVDASVKIRAGKILVRNISVGNADLVAKLQRGRLTASIADADFYSGKVSISAEAEPIGKTLSMDQRWSLKGVQLEPLLKNAFDDDRLSGVGEIKVNIEGTGTSPLELVSSLSGGGYFKIADGAFKGFNLAEMARNIQVAFNPAELKDTRTDFSEMAGTFTISQGIINNPDLSMKSPFLRLTGKGQINLPLYTLEYRLLPQLVDTAQGQGGKDKPALVAVPILVNGSLSNPSFRPDIKGVAQDVMENPDKYKQQIKDAKGAVKGLLKNFKKP